MGSLSQCQVRGMCHIRHIQQNSIQSNLPTQTVELIGEAFFMFFIRRCMGFGAALGCHLIFTHPTAMDSNAVTRLAWWLGVGCGERG